MRKAVFNLEFPSWTKELNIHGHRFYRAEHYQERVKALQHLIVCHSEFSIPRNTGGHSHTAYVDLPTTDQDAVISPGPGSTALDDIILLLSLFTNRDVFALDESTQATLANAVIIADPRESRMLGILACSIPYRKDDSAGDDSPGNAGFAEGLNAVYTLIRSADWQREYGPGHFLLLAKYALLPNHPLSIAFTQCWTIWEHIHGLLTRNEGRRNRRRRTDRRESVLPESVEKIQFLLRRLALKGGEPGNSKRIRALSSIRNKLVHEGKFPEYESIGKDVMLFINLTQFLIAHTLGLVPANVMNTIERLEEFLNAHGGAVASTPESGIAAF